MTTTPESPAPEGPAGAETAERAEDAVLDDLAAIVDDVAETELDPQDVAAMDSLDTPRRLLLVHAHPDDESIGNGATMARYAAPGSSCEVTLVTSNRGERGEVVDPELAHLEGDRAALGAHRVLELASAMEALGVSDHHFLDDLPLAGEDAAATAAVHYEDSGMAWGEGRVAVPAPDTGPAAFALADVDEAASRLAGLIRAVRPQVLLTYEPGGGYGHPDHIQAQRVALRAVELAADPGALLVAGSEPWVVAKVYESVVPRSMLAELGFIGEGDAVPTMVAPDDEIDVVVEAPEQLEAKAAALRAHRSQVRMRGTEMVISHDAWMPVWTTEAYRSSPASRAPETRTAEGGPGTDLFAGLV